MSPPPTDPRHAAGAAVVSALLVVALAAATASFLLVRSERWIDRVAVARDKAQAYELARAGIDYARAVLAADAAGSAVDALDEDWARVLPPLRHEQAEVAGRITDAHGRLNLNNLRRDNGVIDEQALTAYRRLLANVGLGEELAETLADWLDADDSPRAAGAEKAWYQQQGDHAASLGQPLEHLGNLARLKGYAPQVIARLRDFVCVLPGNQPVNLNTARPEVLAALQPGLDLAAARALARSRQGSHFRDLGDYQSRLGDGNWPSPLLAVGTTSRHFVVDVTVSSGRARSHLTALIQRLGDGQRSRILWQTLL